MENNIIKEIREKYHLTRQTLADMLCVSSVTIQNWEKGGSISQTRMPAIRKVIESLENGSGSLVIGQDNITNSPNANATDKDLKAALNTSQKNLEKSLEQNKKSQEQIDKLIEIISKKLT